MDQNKEEVKPSKVEEAKRLYYEQDLKNKRIVRILKGLVYFITTIMLILGVITFIVVFIMGKHFIDSNITIPIITILFGIDAVLLTQINKRISKTNNLKGDVFELFVGIFAIILGIIWLIVALV